MNCLYNGVRDGVYVIIIGFILFLLLVVFQYFNDSGAFCSDKPYLIFDNEWNVTEYHNPCRICSCPTYFDLNGSWSRINTVCICANE